MRDYVCKCGNKVGRIFLGNRKSEEGQAGENVGENICYFFMHEKIVLEKYKMTKSLYLDGDGLVSFQFELCVMIIFCFFPVEFMIRDFQKKERNNKIHTRNVGISKSEANKRMFEIEMSNIK